MTEIPDLDLPGLQERLRYALKIRIKESGKSQNDFAAMADVRSGNMSHYLKGEKLKGITVETVWGLAKSLQARPEWLLTGTEPSWLDRPWTEPKPPTHPKPVAKKVASSGIRTVHGPRYAVRKK